MFLASHDVLRACLLAACLVQPVVAADFEVTEIAPAVFVHQGAYAEIDDPARGDSANIGFVIGARCVAVIDTGGSIATGRALRAAIAAHTDRPVCYVINTHAHFDHVLGNAAFRDDDPTFVGHAALPEALAASREYFLERFAVELADAPAIIAPTLTVDDTHTLDLGGRTLRLEAHPVAHSAADLTVVDDATHTLFTGDLLFVERLPAFDGRLSGWRGWMQTVGGADFAHVVPGHGPPRVAWPAALDAQRRYLDSLADAARTALDAGEFLEDVTADAGAHPPAGWQATGTHARNLARVYRELEWE
ncbi:MAG: quinoprotein relay system zinc metallohydrolase 2 [Gammaproteobacteria bacterium]